MLKHWRRIDPVTDADVHLECCTRVAAVDAHRHARSDIFILGANCFQLDR